jgi:hypothetical protein
MEHYKGKAKNAPDYTIRQLLGGLIIGIIIYYWSK